MKGSFWPEARRRMREKAIELYMSEQFKNLGEVIFLLKLFRKGSHSGQKFIRKVIRIAKLECWAVPYSRSHCPYSWLSCSGW